MLASQMAARRKIRSKRHCKQPHIQYTLCGDAPKLTQHGTVVPDVKEIVQIVTEIIQVMGAS